jgi:hypothetical protein
MNLSILVVVIKKMATNVILNFFRCLFKCSVRHRRIKDAAISHSATRARNGLIKFVNY